MLLCDLRWCLPQGYKKWTIVASTDTCRASELNCLSIHWVLKLMQGVSIGQFINLFSFWAGNFVLIFSLGTMAIYNCFWTDSSVFGFIFSLFGILFLENVFWQWNWRTFREPKCVWMFLFLEKENESMSILCLCIYQCPSFVSISRTPFPI